MHALPADNLDTTIDVEALYDSPADDSPSDVRIVLHPAQAAALVNVLSSPTSVDPRSPIVTNFLADLVDAIVAATAER